MGKGKSKKQKENITKKKTEKENIAKKSAKKGKLEENSRKESEKENMKEENIKEENIKEQNIKSETIRLENIDPQSINKEDPKAEKIYQKRLEKHHDELRWLYMELYQNGSMFAELCENMRQFYLQRNQELKDLDLKREACSDWYKQNDLLGMMFYIDNFAGNMKGVEAKLDYIEQCNVNYIHLMPFLETPEGRSDGGYAVADFRKVQENLGTMEDLESLTAA